jgi:hypothetical protein
MPLWSAIVVSLLVVRLADRPRLVRNRVIRCLQRPVAVFVGLRSRGGYSLGRAATAPVGCC